MDVGLFLLRGALKKSTWFISQDVGFFWGTTPVKTCLHASFFLGNHIWNHGKQPVNWLTPTLRQAHLRTRHLHTLRGALRGTLCRAGVTGQVGHTLQLASKVLLYVGPT